MEKSSTDFKLLSVVSLALVGDFCVLSANGPSGMQAMGIQGGLCVWSREGMKVQGGRGWQVLASLY